MRSAGCEPSRPACEKYWWSSMSPPWATAACWRSPLTCSAASPRSARSPLRMQSVAAVTAARFEASGRRSAFGQAPAAATPSRVLGAGRAGARSRGPPLESRRGRRPLRSVTASPRWPSVLPTFSVPAGPRGSWPPLTGPPAGPPATPQPASAAVAAASRAGISAERFQLMPFLSRHRSENLSGLDGRYGASTAVDAGRRQPRAGAEVRERLDDLGVELGARPARDLLGRVLDAEGLLVRALVDEDVEHVGHVHEAPDERDVGARQRVRVARAVPALVVGARDALRHLEQLGVRVGEHAR